MNWAQLAYQYVVGGLLFGVSLVLCFRLGGADMRVPSDRKTFWISLAGLAGFFTFHTIWIVLASG